MSIFGRLFKNSSKAPRIPPVPTKPVLPPPQNGGGMRTEAGMSQSIEKLSEAAYAGNVKEIRTAIQEGVDLNARDHDGVPALYWAAARGHSDSLRTLLAAGANPNTTSAKKGWSPLMIAAQRGDLEAVRELLKRGADPNLKAPDGQTALLLAAYDGRATVLETLLDKSGANVATQLPDAATALHLSAQEGHAEAVKVLLKHGANVNSRRMDGSTPLLLACGRGLTKIVEILLAGGASSDIPGGSKSLTPLTFARAQGHEAVMRLLQDHGRR
jgi:ankyrin repeat protein